MDSIIEEMSREILDLRNTTPHRNMLRRWATHLREVVQPQLDELEMLKAAPVPASKAARKAVSA
jgi:hypothetical protein